MSGKLVSSSSTGDLVRAVGTAALFALAGAAHPGLAHAQATGAVTGRVVEAGTRQPLAGAQLVVVGTQIGGLTDQDGQYRLEQVPVGKQRVRVRLIGYSRSTKSVNVAEGQVATLNFSLQEQALKLDELVVTGTAGGQTKRSLGHDVAQVNTEQLSEVSANPSVQNMLGGATPGVNLDFASGTVNAGTNIRIRGASSLSLNSNPVIYIDGIRVSNETVSKGGGHFDVGVSETTPPSRLNDLNPQNIESIEVIKGPAAATLYGTQASNGVINIITKSGQEGAPRFNVEVSGGFNKLPEPAPEMFPTNYFRCQGSGDCQPGEIVPVNVLRHDKRVLGKDWFQWGPSQNYSASVSGGGEGVRYYFSGSWGREEGVLPYNWQNKLNGRANMNWAPTGDLGVQLSMGFVDSRLRSWAPNQPITVAINWSCPAPGCERNTGNPAALDGPMRGYLAYLPDILQNKVFGWQEVRRPTASLQLTWNPVGWLDQRLNVGGDFVETINSELYKPHERGSQNPGGEKEIQQQSERNITVDYAATGEVSPTDGLTFSTSTGLQFIKEEQEWVWALGDQFSVPSLETIPAGATITADEGFVANKTFGVYVQEQISWQNRLFLTGAVRADDNSAFGENFDFVVYPKISGSWVLSEESFMEDIGWLNEFKLRGAWGQSGQQPKAFAAVRRWRPVPGPGETGALVRENIGNPELQPETGSEIEVGFDAALFNQRLSLTFNAFRQERNDAIVEVPVKPSRGFPGIQLRNIGSTLNKGIELSVQGRAIERDNVSLDLQGSFFANDSEITEMGGFGPFKIQGENPTTGFSNQFFVEDMPLAGFYLKRVLSAEIVGEGSNARATNIMCEGGEIIPGTENLSRGGGGPVPCDEAPAIFRGTPMLSRSATGSFTLSLFNRFRVYAQVDYEGGVTMVNGDIAGAHLFFRNTKAILERDDPKLLAYEALGREGINQAGLINADFAKLRRLSVRYRFPEHIGQLVGADESSFSISMRNLWTIWQGTDEKFGREVIDPEMRHTRPNAADPGGLSGYVQGRLPNTEIFTASLNLTF